MKLLSTLLLIPKAAIYFGEGRSSDSLLLLRLPVVVTVAKNAKETVKLTASGNVQDLHLVPFSFQNLETFAVANVGKSDKKYLCP